ncbi:retrovirus-related pol polyprotein from transposon TNT 1-94 [Tanacetum coccineum]
MDVKSAFLYRKIEEEMSSMGELRFFLGLQVKQKKDDISISQDKYVDEILNKFGFTEVKTASTPMETQKPLLKDEDGEECKKQTVVANSTTEAEYVAASSCSDGFEQIMDFLNAHSIRHALTISPTIYISCIEQFWSTIKAKTINGEVKLHALVDGKKIIITQSAVRRDLQLEDAEDKAVHKELGDSLVRASTTTSSLVAEQDSGGPRCQETMGETIAQTRFENVSKHSNDSLLARGNTLQSDEDSVGNKSSQERRLILLKEVRDARR